MLAKFIIYFALIQLTYRQTVTDRHTHTQTDRETDIQKYRHTDRHTQTDSVIHTHTHRHTHTDKQTYINTDIYTHTYIHTDTYRQTHRHIVRCSITSDEVVCVSSAHVPASVVAAAVYPASGV